MSPAVDRRGLLLVLSSPSGAGKTTLANRLIAADEGIHLSVSVTTRPARPGEVDGRDYHFIDRPTYDAKARDGELLEWAEVFGNGYGTPRAPVMAALEDGHDVLFDIDWQGARQLSARVPTDLVRVFILPPDMLALEQRLRRRAQDSDEIVQRRMAAARDEISHWDEYDYVVVNADLEVSLAKLRAILAAERLKRTRQPGLGEFVERLLLGSR